MDKRLKQLNSLRTFECASRHQSYSKAAAELFISQAAVSQQMRQLETSIGCKLFIRNGRQMQLTQSGQILYQTTHQAFDILIKGLNSIQSEQVAGYLTITSSQTFISLWLMPRLYRFSQKHPEIKIKVTSSNDFEDLQQGHIDLAIRFKTSAQINDDSDMTYEYIGEDYVYPVCSSQLAKQTNFSKPEDLLQCWLINLKNQGAIDWPNWFLAAGVEQYQDHLQWAEVDTGDMALSAVLSGHGFTLASKAILSQYVDKGQLVVPFKIQHPTSFKRYLVYDSTSAKSERLNIFIDWLKEEFALDKAGLI